MKLLLVIALGALLFMDANAFLTRRRNMEPPIPMSKSAHRVETRWIPQRVDHWDPQNNSTFQMRYMTNDQHFQSGGPMIIYLGGEWTISAGSLLGGQIFDIAKQHNGYLFYTEHRYYGQSRPTIDASTENLRFLSVDQALADVAVFIQYVKATTPGLQNSKVVVVGGSYSASMAAWFRLKYPHLAAGALASSAPMVAIGDFYQYYEVVNDALTSVGSPACVRAIRDGVDAITAEFGASGGADRISKLFNLCTPINLSTQFDSETLYVTIAETFAGLVQYHRPGDIEGACRVLENTELGTPLQRLASYVTSSSSSCIDGDYAAIRDFLSGDQWGTASTSSSYRQWIYQTCTEYGYYQTSLSDNQPFGNNTFHIDYFIQMCSDVYGGVFTDGASEILNSGIMRTNGMYGGVTPEVTNVIFTHGSVDPWHAIGVLDDLNESSPAIIIPVASHCNDLNSISSFDSPEMKAAKLRVQEIVAQWLTSDTSVEAKDIC